MLPDRFQDPKMEPAAKVLVAIISVVIAAISGFAIVKEKQGSAKAVVQSLEVQELISTNLHVGDAEEKILPFFRKNQWKEFGHSSLLNRYDANVFLRRDWKGAAYFVQVTIQTDGGFIRHIEVTERINFM